LYRITHHPEESIANNQIETEEMEDQRSQVWFKLNVGIFCSHVIYLILNISAIICVENNKIIALNTTYKILIM
jgi:hypothetical protein